MPSVTAKRQFPDLIFVTPRFEVYKAVSQQIREIIEEHTPIIVPLSLDADRSAGNRTRQVAEKALPSPYRRFSVMFRFSKSWTLSSEKCSSLRISALCSPW